MADDVRYKCDLSPILYKPTMMFQTRTFSFPLTAESFMKLNYNFHVTYPDGRPDHSGVFSIQPASGTVAPGQTQTITVKFSPQEVEDCNRLLVADIPLLDPAQPPLQRQLNGRVLRPWCHFELPDSDYISHGRRRPDLPGPDGGMAPLDPTTRVLEIESLGVKVLNTRRFYVLNPTGISYDFSWSLVQPETELTAPFKCLTRRGTISAGRRFEMVFEYLPQTDNVSEQFWMFRIPEQNIELLFVLVGNVAEPRVSFDRPALNFEKVLVGGKLATKVYLVNSEHMPFEFKIDRASYEGTAENVSSSTWCRPHSAIPARLPHMSSLPLLRF